MSPRSSTTVAIDVALRAVAISWVVFNHADWALQLPGGMTLLLVLSGFSFARFALEGRSAAETRGSIASLCWRIWLPSFLVVLFEQLYLGRLEPRDLLFIGIWFDHERVQLLDVWYLQVLLQLLVLLYGLFLIRPFAAAFARNPLAWSFALLGFTLGLRAFLPLLWDTSGRQHQLPHLFLWNFTLGWAVYFAIETEKLAMKLAALACAVLAACVAWGGPQNLQFWWLGLGTLALLFVERLRMPVLAARVVTLVSQATFAIYLLHRDFMHLYKQVPWRWHHTFPRWVVAMVGSIGAWVLFTAVVRALRRQRTGTQYIDYREEPFRQAA